MAASWRKSGGGWVQVRISFSRLRRGRDVVAAREQTTQPQSASRAFDGESRCARCSRRWKIGRLFAVVPLPTPSIDGSFGGSQASSPMIAYDPQTPNDMVSVYAIHSGTEVTLQGQYSTNGGTSWTTFNINPFFYPRQHPVFTFRTTGAGPFTGVNRRRGCFRANGRGARKVLFRSRSTRNPSVGFDRLHNFYVSFAEHSTDKPRMGISRFRSTPSRSAGHRRRRVCQTSRISAINGPWESIRRFQPFRPQWIRIWQVTRTRRPV